MLRTMLSCNVVLDLLLCAACALYLHVEPGVHDGSATVVVFRGVSGRGVAWLDGEVPMLTLTRLIIESVTLTNHWRY
jgi:hypothetical protein